jgi:general secretion pathway protein G
LERGFTLIELLVVVAIIGIIAAMVMVNFLNALDKSKQKRSMADLRSIGTAVETYAVDNSTYPKSISSWSGLRATVSPAYMRSPPDADGWSLTWDVATTANGKEYTIGSNGKDATVGPRAGGTTGDFDCDIVFVNGSFFQWPEGVQT